MRKDNIVYIKAKAFSVRIIRFRNYLCAEKKEYVLADQLLRSATSIGANIAESIDAVSTKDFLNKLSISLKECSETKYWLEILYESGIIDTKIYDSLYEDCNELYKILSSITRTIASKK